MELIKCIITPDGKNRIEIVQTEDGRYRYVTLDDQYRNDPRIQTPPFWSPAVFSGLFDTADAAEVAAREKLAWLGKIYGRVHI